MENKEVPEEIMVDYVAKESTQGSILNAFLAWGIAIAYTAYTFYSIMTEFSPEQLGGEAACGLFLMLFFMLGVPSAFMYVSLPYEGIGKEIEAARKFLLEAGQEASKENMNLLLNRYHKGNWQDIEDMLYEDRKVLSAENIKLVSGNESGKLKAALPAK
jgi:hypothetical protein